MTISSDGQICFGVKLVEDQELPWDDYDEIEEWWIYEVLKFNHSFEMFTDEGDWIGGKEWPKDKIDSYYTEKYKFIEENPKLPIELVMHCSYAYPEYILAVPGTFLSANRGYPKTFVTYEVKKSKIKELWDFCKKYKLETEGEVGWYLSSLYG